MKIKALTNFCGSLCMAKNEVRECNDEVVLADLLKAGYVESAEEKMTSDEGENKETQAEDEQTQNASDIPKKRKSSTKEEVKTNESQ